MTNFKRFLKFTVKNSIKIISLRHISSFSSGQDFRKEVVISACHKTIISTPVATFQNHHETIVTYQHVSFQLSVQILSVVPIAWLGIQIPATCQATTAQKQRTTEPFFETPITRKVFSSSCENQKKMKLSNAIAACLLRTSYVRFPTFTTLFAATAATQVRTNSSILTSSCQKASLPKVSKMHTFRASGAQIPNEKLPSNRLPGKMGATLQQSRKKFYFCQLLLLPRFISFQFQRRVK